MQQITFECEVITPMFLAGADGNTPELRPPSIKGALRFWWRALNGHLPLKELKRIEGEIFGNTEKRSKLLIRTSLNEDELNQNIKLKNQSNDYESGFKKHFNLNWQNDNRTYTGKHASITYLLYSLLFQGKRPFIDVGFTFKVTLTAFDTEILKKGIASFWLLSNFGGLGTRTRRGAGCFRVKNIECNNFNFEDINIEFTSNKSTNDFIKDNYKNVTNILKEKLTNPLEKAIYTSLLGSEIIVSSIDNTEGWANVLCKVGQKFMDFRTKNKSEWQKTAIFGVPIRHSNNSTVQLPNSSRRASPLFISIFHINDQLQWVVIKMGGNFANDKNGNEDLKIISKRKGQKNKDATKGQTKWTLLNDFINNEVKPIGTTI